MQTRGKNLVFNGFFDIEAADSEFPMGWVQINGDEGTRLEWSTDHVAFGNHSVRVINTSYTACFTGIVQNQCYSIETHADDTAWELAAWMRTERPGASLRLMAYFMDDQWRYLSENHLKFVSTVELQRYGGLIFAPEGAMWVKVACGVHDDPGTLPSDLWISWVTMRKID
jgi:hypothetical protein